MTAIIRGASAGPGRPPDALFGVGVLSTSEAGSRAAGRSLARRRLLVHAVVAAALFVWAFAVLEAARSNTVFHPDEYNQIFTARWFTNLVRGDLANEDWSDSYYNLTHPPGHRYFLGAGLWLQGHDPEKVSRQEQENRRRRRDVTETVLRDARRISVLFGAGAIALLYVVGARLGAAPAGLVGALLAGASPYVQEHFTLAVMDALLVFWILAALVLSMAAFGRPGGFGAGSGVLTGLCLGLGLLNKLTAVLSFPALGLACLGAALARAAGTGSPSSALATRRSPLVWGGIVGLACWGLFVAVNPFLWVDPIGRTAAMFKQRQYEIMERQQRRTPQDAVQDWQDRPGLVLGHTLINRTWANATLGVPLDVPLAALGLAALGVMVRDDWRAGRRLGPAACFGLWILSYLVGITVAYGMDWDRYVLPLFLAAALLSGLGIQRIASRALGLVPANAWPMASTNRSASTRA